MATPISSTSNDLAIIDQWLSVTQTRLTSWRQQDFLGKVFLAALILLHLFLAICQNTATRQEQSWYLGWLCLACLAFVWLRLYRKRASRLEAAWYLDARYQLAQRIVSCCHCCPTLALRTTPAHDPGNSSPIHNLLLADAAVCLRRLTDHPQDWHPQRLRRYVWVVNLALAGLLLVWAQVHWWLPTHKKMPAAISSELLTTGAQAVAALRRGNAMALAQELEGQLGSLAAAATTEQQLLATVQQLLVRTANKHQQLAAWNHRLPTVPSSLPAKPSLSPLSPILPASPASPWPPWPPWPTATNSKASPLPESQIQPLSQVLADLAPEEKQALARALNQLAAQTSEESLAALSQAIVTGQSPPEIATRLTQAHDQTAGHLAALERSRSLLQKLATQLPANRAQDRDNAGSADPHLAMAPAQSGIWADSTLSPRSSPLPPAWTTPPLRPPTPPTDARIEPPIEPLESGSTPAHFKKAWWPANYHRLVRQYFGDDSQNTSDK